MSNLPPDLADLRIGDSVQLQIENKCHVAKLIGYLEGQGFIVTIPDDNGIPIQPGTGQSLAVRFLNYKNAYTFDTEVRHVASEPFPHLHLTYRKKTQALKERQYGRIRINIVGSADISGGESFACVVRDISIGGALIALDTQTGAINDALLLTLRVAINGIGYELSLDSEIRSVRLKDSQNGHDTLVLQGVAFQDLSEQDVLALAAFDLLPGWDAPDSEPERAGIDSP